MHFERHFTFQNEINYIFPEKPEKNSRFHHEIYVRVRLP